MEKESKETEMRKKTVAFFKRFRTVVKIKRWIYGVPEKCFRRSLKLRWKICTSIPGWKGINTGSDEPELIVSLTSFPARIETVQHTVASILLQSHKPDKVILWLAPEQFPGGTASLPKGLLALRKYGLTIGWCRDIRSFKKLIPSLRKYPDAVIVTADDDLYYERNWLKILYKEYKAAPELVHCHRITEFYLQDGRYDAVGRGKGVMPKSSFLYKVTGCGGVLYPPHCMAEDILREDIFLKICSTNDDIWFWLMAVLNGVRISVPKHNIPKLHYVESTQKGPTLSSINDQGENLFWIQFHQVIEHYPEIDRRLQKEYEKAYSC